MNDPTRCPACRQARKQQTGGGRNNYGGGSFGSGGSRPQREMFPAVCANCGIQTEVPFQPSGDKPVCFSGNAGCMLVFRKKEL